MAGNFGVRKIAWAPYFAALGFAAVVVLCVVVARDFVRNSVALVRADLADRAEGSVRRLAVSLRQLDFREIGELGDELRGQGLRLRVVAAGAADCERGGAVYDSLPKAEEWSGYWEWRSTGEYAVGVGLPQAAVLNPVRKATPLFLLAVLVGAAGMLFVFFAFYRQRAQIRALEKMERERREFIADFSHELKTPLTGILGAAEMLESSPLADMIMKSARRLNSLAQQILELSRLEAPSATLVSREELLARAVDQLVENAHRHSGSDKVTVREEESGGYHRWIVEDRGIGVPEGERERIFERFYRVDPSRSEVTGGAGLGLAIVRRIARRFGGDCICESVQPHGARFVLSVSA